MVIAVRLPLLSSSSSSSSSLLLFLEPGRLVPCPFRLCSLLVSFSCETSPCAFFYQSDQVRLDQTSSGRPAIAIRCLHQCVPLDAGCSCERASGPSRDRPAKQTKGRGRTLDDARIACMHTDQQPLDCYMTFNRGT